VIKGFVISMPSQQQYVNLLKTSIINTDSSIEVIDVEATVPDTIENHLQTEFRYWPGNYNWTWPKTENENRIDNKTGVYMFAYNANNIKRKEACSISHMRLWDKCVTLNEPIIIFEADAKLTRQFEIDEMQDSKLVGLNDPRNATRRSKQFHQYAISSTGCKPAPNVNSRNEHHPQGIAGASAYYITPAGAQELLDGLDQHGVWPNDAYICKELFPWIRIVYPYFSVVQGTPSTTKA
jgi:GR25 family glycosyltransferase involved in LPS biosynthesis